MVDINKQILELNTAVAEEIINIYKEHGYTDLILTIPVLEDGKIEQEKYLENYYALQKNITGINLYLGNEIYYHFKLIHYLKKKEIMTFNNSNYLLLHLPVENEPIQLKTLIRTLKNYQIIISCIDQYKYYSLKDLYELKNEGALFLVQNKNLLKRKVKKLFKKELIDFVASYDDYTSLIVKPKFLDEQYYQKIVKDNFQNIINWGL